MSTNNAHELAITHIKNDQINTAYTLLIDLAESKKSSDPMRAALLYLLASECKKRQNKDNQHEFTEAANLFLKNSSHSPNPKSALLCASQCFVKAGDFDNAKQALEKSKKIIHTQDKIQPRPVVIIDDSTTISLKLKGYSEKLGYASIDSFENGKKGIAHCKSLFEKNFYPIVLLDMGLPDIEGDKVARQLFEMRPDLQIVVITADEKSTKRVNDTISAGVVAFIQKPFTIDEVKTALELAEDEYSLLKK